MKRHVIALSLVLILGSLRAWPQEATNEPTVTLRIEVSMPDGAVFYIPAVGDGQMSGVIPFLHGRFAGIRITPRMHGDSVQIEVSVLTAMNKKISDATCDDVQSWTSEDAGSYEGRENSSLLLSGLARLGLPVLKLKVAHSSGPPPGGFSHPYAHSLAFCGCEYPSPRSIVNPDGSSASGVAGIASYPDAGKCVQIIGCGRCCRTAEPTSIHK